jgi:hypothetical protein
MRLVMFFVGILILLIEYHHVNAWNHHHHVLSSSTHSWLPSPSLPLEKINNPQINGNKVKETSFDQIIDDNTINNGNDDRGTSFEEEENIEAHLHRMRYILKKKTLLQYLKSQNVGIPMKLEAIEQALQEGTLSDSEYSSSSSWTIEKPSLKAPSITNGGLLKDWDE